MIEIKTLFFDVLKHDPVLFEQVRMQSASGLVFFDISNPQSAWGDATFGALTQAKGETLMDLSAHLHHQSWQQLTSPDVSSNQPLLIEWRIANRQTVKLMVKKHLVAQGRCILGFVDLVPPSEDQTLTGIRQAVDLHSFYFIKTDIEGKYTYVNEFFCRNMGIGKPEDVIGTQSLAYIIPEDHHKCLDVVAKCFEYPNQVHPVKLRKPYIDQQHITNLWNFTLLLDEAGQPSEFICSGHDISNEEWNLNELWQSREHFKILYEKAPTMLHSIDPNGFIVSVSDFWLSEMGYTRNEVLGKKSMDFLTEESAQRAKNEVLPSFLKQKQCYDVAYQMVKKNGQVIDVNLSAVMLYHPTFRQEVSFAVVNDVTEKLKAERKLRDSEERYRELVEVSSEVICKHSADGTYLYLTPSSQAIIGYKPEELVGSSPFDAIHPEDLGKIRNKSFLARTRNAQTSEAIYRFRHQNGSYIWMESISHPIIDANGRITSFVTKSRDISHRVANLQALKTSEERLSTAIAGSQVGLWEWFVQTGEANFNEQWVNMLGYTVEELQPMSINTWLERIEPDSLIRANQELDKCFSRQKDDYYVETQMKHKAGHLVWIRAAGKVVEWTEDGKPWRMIGTHIDITASKTMELELKQNENDLKVLLELTIDQNSRFRDYSYITSHNIKSAVARVGGLTQLLKQDPLNEIFLSSLETSVDDLNISIQHINQLLHLEKELETDISDEYDLSEAIKRCLELNLSEIQSREVEIIKEIPDHLMLRTVPAYFDSIVQNLIGNALKYGIRPDVKQITVVLKRLESSGKVLFEVRDSGIGIDLEKYRKRLFILGSRLHHQSQGHGFGLYLVKRQVELLHGTIEVESELYQGSVFRVII